MRPKPKNPAGFPQITREERYLAGLYHAFMTRYGKSESLKLLPLMSAKLFAKRVGFERFMYLLTDRGTAAVAERCRNELVIRQQFLAHMLATYPPDTQEEAEGAIADMAEDLAIIDSPEGAMRLLKFLDRVRTRELMRQPTNGSVH